MQQDVTHVCFRSSKGVELASIKEFNAFSRDVRALLVVEGEVEFLDADGDTVPLEDALRQLRDSFRPPAMRGDRFSDVGLPSKAA